MKIKDIIAVIEQAAPLHLQESYDNSGLIVGHPEAETESALLCVDITDEVLDEAETLGARLIVSHHPIVFHPLKRLTGSNHVQRAVERAIRSGIALYACHTNLDTVKDGMSYRLAGKLGVGNLSPLCPLAPGEGNGTGVVGELAHEMALGDFMQAMKKELGLKVIRHSDICKETVRKVALCTGSGASFMEAAANSGADIYITADLKYNDFMTPDGNFVACDIGHFESEYCAIDLLFDIIRKKMITFALHKSAKARNPVNYTV